MPIFKNCKTCGIEIKLRPSDVKKNNFCSKECYFKHKRRNQIITVCERCGAKVVKSPSKKTKRNFCSPQCLMKTLNSELNPTRMNPDTRKKLRKAHLGKGEGKSYPKVYGRHEHRINAEKLIGRPLREGEVVHHIDRDKRNNRLDNLMVFSSQKEHAAWHAKENERHD